jgi:EAL domain-containing protein (putative c-di-GMP-specific phosphodiesterase class I)
VPKPWRWHETEQGWFFPSLFIPMAESLGLIDKLGQAVWKQAQYGTRETSAIYMRLA